MIEERVLKARPSQSDSDYELKKRAYCNMIKLVMELVQKLQASCDKIFADYIAFFDKLWECIEKGKDAKSMVKAFTTMIENETNATWAPIFNILDELIKKINNPTDGNVGQESSNETNWLNWYPF
jgi:hypothetical protein